MMRGFTWLRSINRSLPGHWLIQRSVILGFLIIFFLIVAPVAIVVGFCVLWVDLFFVFHGFNNSYCF